MLESVFGKFSNRTPIYKMTGGILIGRILILRREAVAIGSSESKPGEPFDRAAWSR